MKRTLLPLAACALALAACRSPRGRDAMADVPCICGSFEAALEGCGCALCASGEGNPENPDCACAGIEFVEED